MIKFTKLRWKNFLSTGNVFTEIELDRSSSTVIIGDNGAGKSTILDALTYVLFNKPFRKINKPQLLNTINNKGLMVEIEFTSGRTNYLIRRGFKPNVFEIHKNGNMIDQPGNAREYQAMLEEHILKLNYKSFTQIVVLGNASFTPFMQLTPKDRRDVIEDLLDIQIFSNMNLLLRERLQINKQHLVDSGFQIDLLSEKIEVQEQYLKQLEQDVEKQIDGLDADIREQTKLSSTAAENYDKLDRTVQALMRNISNKDSIDKKSSKVEDLLRRLSDKELKATDRIKFFEAYSDCPTCDQPIDDELKGNKIDQTKGIIEATVEALTKLQSEKTKLENKLNTIYNKQQEIQASQISMQGYQREIHLHEESITKINAKIAELKNDKSIGVEADDKIVQLKRSLSNYRKSKTKLLHDKELYEIASTMLKDGGIKTKIIKQYVPVMNKLINKYLAALDFFVNFELDEEFNEVIRSRHRDEFSYSSFSEGEKMRIDLALLFTWRAVAKLKNSTNTNLLILDEVFDASLDTTGCDEFLKLLSGLGQDNNVFVISHKPDLLEGKFESTIKFQKSRNFSEIAA